MTVRGLVGAVVVGGSVSMTGAPACAQANWLMGGQNTSNTRFQQAETKIGPKSVRQLRARWATGAVKGDIVSTPAVDGNAVYVTDTLYTVDSAGRKISEGGNLYRIDADTGKAQWSYPISTYSGVPNDVVRATPAVTDDSLIFGTQYQGPLGTLSDPTAKSHAIVVAVDKGSGALRWKTIIDTHPASRIVQGAVVYGDVVYLGVTSYEEVIAAIVANYACCNFRGSVVALDRRSGAKRWQWYSMPPRPDGYAGVWYSGGALWGSTPVVDPVRRLLYVTTGNNYSVPLTFATCIGRALATRSGGEDQARACQGSADNYFDAIVALDLESGTVRWAFRPLAFDAHTHACLDPRTNPANCPSPRGPDFDFAQGPMLLDAGDRQLLVAGQKSGVLWAVNPDDGSVVWQTKVGPGGMTGGMQWGSATDGERIYVAITNHSKEPWTLQGGPQNGNVVTGGFWSAVSARTGQIVWQSPDPAGGLVQGMVTAANGVVFGGSLGAGAAAGNSLSNMFGFDAETGHTLWSFSSVGSVVSGPAVADGRVYWGSGYYLWGGAKGGVLYAFEAPEIP